MDRRNFLKIAGRTGVVVAAAGAGVGGYAVTRAPEHALQPWLQAGSLYRDPMRRALSYAILAPNPHNRQPWVVDLKSDTEAVLSCDLQRLLPATDPYDRQIVIGLGCFLELFVLAAAADGQRARIVLFPRGEPGERLDTRPIAGLQLVAEPGLAPDPLFAFALERHTNRNPYDTRREVRQEELEAVIAAAGTGVTAGGIAGGEHLQRLRALTAAALRDEIFDPEAFRESIDLMRIGAAEIDANPDGISLRGPKVEALSLLGMLGREGFTDPSSASFRIGLEMADAQALTAMGFVWIKTAGNARRAQIAAGRAYLRSALSATARGLAMQPMSQALQEYPAMAAHYTQLHAMLAANDDARVQMLARIGYAEPVAAAPRWALATRIQTG